MTNNSNGQHPTDTLTVDSLLNGQETAVRLSINNEHVILQPDDATNVACALLKAAISTSHSSNLYNYLTTKADFDHNEAMRLINDMHNNT